jgi:proton-dependent oligopeptide transporter, POT family
MTETKPIVAPIYVRALKRMLGKEQPDGLYLLFSVEMWERFSYYGMRALLVLYLVGSLGWNKERAYNLYGNYTMLVYLTPLIGGYLADRFIGTHRSMVIGAALITIGHFTLALPSENAFFIGLGLIIIGTGFFKSNVSTMVGQLYSENDRRRDAGFTVFYMGINMGAFIGQIVCGSLAEDPRLGWHYGFGAAGVGMTLGLLAYLRNKRNVLGDIGERPSGRAKRNTDGTQPTATPLSREERHGVAAIFILLVFNVFFWLAFEQAGSTMNSFASERTDRVVLGYTVPAAWFQSINPLVIILFAPVFARLWSWLSKKGLEPSTPVKMALALCLLGLGFVFMIFAASNSDGGLKVSPLWLIAAYSFHTFGELCLSPVGLSMVTKLAPLRFASLLMGSWFLSSAIAHKLGGTIAASVERIERGEVFHLLGGQADFFLIFVVTSGVGGVLLFAMSPIVKKLMHGRA